MLIIKTTAMFPNNQTTGKVLSGRDAKWRPETHWDILVPTNLDQM